MLHILPVLCLIFFVLFLELQLKKEMYEIERQFKELKKLIDSNALGIRNNKDKIEENKTNIDKLNGKHL